MRAFRHWIVPSLLLGSTGVLTAISAVSPEEAKQLGGVTLTAMGAEKAGNKAGTIPEFTGEPLRLDVDPKALGFHKDPFANEKPLYSITSQNFEKYASILDGQVALFKKYPGYRIDVYPTHRTSVLPKYVLDNTMKNAAQCRDATDGLVIENCLGGVPFPIPKTGAQVMWNHLTAFDFYSQNTTTMSYYVAPNGKRVLSNASIGSALLPAYDPARKTPLKGNEPFYKLRLDYSAPTRSVGEKLLILDAQDLVNTGRRVYSYIPGQRRVKLAPDLAYDTPSPFSGGSQTMDDGKAFMGPLDRYDFTLVGKKEKLIVANNFRTIDYKACPEDKFFTANYPNPDCMRYELHRVWVVNAKIKPGYRHIYPKRSFYWDEDNYGGGQSENYDATGALYRIATVISWPTEAGGTSNSFTINMDLQTGAWSAPGGINCNGCGFWTTAPKPNEYFTPEALAGEGIR